MDFDEAKKKPYFYLVLLCMMLTDMSLQGLGGIALPHMYDLGIDKQFVANLSTVSFLCLMGSKLLAGFVFDRRGMRLTMNICLFSAFLSLAGLVMISNTPLGLAIAWVRIIFGSIALPLETVMLPLFASELFGNKSFDKIVGFFTAASTAGFALGSPFANLCFDLFGNYNVPFIAFATLMTFITVTMQFVLNASGRDKKKILELEEGVLTAQE